MCECGHGFRAPFVLLRWTPNTAQRQREQRGEEKGPTTTESELTGAQKRGSQMRGERTRSGARVRGHGWSELGESEEERGERGRGIGWEAGRRGGDLARPPVDGRRSSKDPAPAPT